MPKPSHRPDSNQNRWGLPTEFPEDLDCVRVYFPRSQQYKSKLLGQLYQLTQQIWWDRDEAHTAKDVAALWREAYRATLATWGKPCDVQPNNQQPGNATGGGTFDDFLNLLQELDVKFRSPDGTIYEPVIDLVECGCGGSTGGTDSNDSLGGIPGATPGTAYSGDIPSLCDLITGDFATYLSERVDDMLGAISQRTFVAEQIKSLFPVPIVDGWIDQVRENITAIELQLTDPTWLNDMNIAMVKAWNDPVSPPLTRNDLYKFVRFLPPISEGAPMLPAMSLWSGFANLSEINGALRYYVGDGDPAVCKPVFIASGTGREPYVRESDTANVIEFPNGAINLIVRIFPLGVPYALKGVSTAILPHDYTDVEVVGGGLVITSNLLDDPADQPRMYYNNFTGNAINASDLMADGNNYHYAGRDAGVVITETWFQIRAAVEASVGVAITELGTWTGTFTQPEIVIGTEVTPDGSATVAYGWTVEVEQ